MLAGRKRPSTSETPLAARAVDAGTSPAATRVSPQRAGAELKRPRLAGAAKRLISIRSSGGIATATASLSTSSSSSSSFPPCVAPYVHDIKKLLRACEAATQPGAAWLEQPHLNATMRAILVDWLAEPPMVTPIGITINGNLLFHQFLTDSM